jgi:predicted negative regulator of RcsB-dependent stress response
MEHLISLDDAQTNLLACATYLAEGIKSADGHAEAMRAILPFYLEKREVDLAAEFANSIEDPFTRDRLLTRVAEKCAAIDDEEYAFQLVEAIEDNGAQAQARERIALQKSSKSEFDKAFEIADTLEHPDNVFAAIAVNASEDGQPEIAENAISSIEFPYAKVVTLQSIAGQKTEQGENKEAVAFLERALEPADDIDFAEEKIRALVDIASHFTDARRNDRAIETLDKAKHLAEGLENVHRDSFLSAVAYGFFRAGSVDLADRTLDLVNDKTQMSSTLVGFAREYWAQDENGDAVETLEEAYEILKSQHEKETRDSRAKFSLFGSIAALFASYDKPERAVEIAQGIADENEQMSALAQIAQILTSQGKDEAALAAVHAIAEDSQRLMAFIGISDSLQKLGKKEEAIRTLNEAAHLAETIPQLATRSAALNELAKRFVGFEETTRARELTHENLETIAAIRDESSQSVCLATLSEIYDSQNFELTPAEKEILQAIIRKAEA